MHAPVDETGLLKLIHDLHGVRAIGVDHGGQSALFDAGKIIDAGERGVPRRGCDQFSSQGFSLRGHTNLQELASQREREPIGRWHRWVGRSGA